MTEGDTVTWSHPKGALVWSEPACYDCSGCVAACPFHALEARHGKIVADMDRCTLCTICERVCPTEAFAIVRTPRDARSAAPRTEGSATGSAPTAEDGRDGG